MCRGSENHQRLVRVTGLRLQDLKNGSKGFWCDGAAFLFVLFVTVIHAGAWFRKQCI